MKVKLDGKYRTKNGKKVRRVLCVDRNYVYPVVVEMVTGEITSYTENGKYHRDYDTNSDLVEITEWDDFKIDDPVMVSNIGGDMWEKRYFAGLNENGEPTTWYSGATSWTAENVTAWKYCRKPTEEELIRK